MKWCSLVAVAVLLSACGNRQSDAGYVADLQAKSPLGPIAGWKLDPALQQIKVQQMRDRAYRYCLTEQASDQDCLEEQDHSLFEYANSFRLVRIFRSESLPTLPFAVAHKQDPAAFIATAVPFTRNKDRATPAPSARVCQQVSGPTSSVLCPFPNVRFPPKADVRKLCPTARLLCSMTAKLHASHALRHQHRDLRVPGPMAPNRPIPA